MDTNDPSGYFQEAPFRLASHGVHKNLSQMALDADRSRVLQQLFKAGGILPRGRGVCRALRFVIPRNRLAKLTPHGQQFPLLVPLLTGGVKLRPQAQPQSHKRHDEKQPKVGKAERAPFTKSQLLRWPTAIHRFCHRGSPPPLRFSRPRCRAHRLRARESQSSCGSIR